VPHVTIDDATIYYQAYGEEYPNQVPIVLIHGATNDGQSDWGSIAPELARRYRVFAPDCRGHGRSSNPRMSYSFQELADDVAAFVRAIGYERAHIIGHSNGGNVALVTLMEHPEIVQTAVLQAANAYVTRYLVEREPKVFDPERMQCASPDWLDQVKSLHNEVHGPEYWRDLLWLTMREIISEPNYAPFELKRVDRPTLVIMGAKDAVNARDEHAQYIANNISDAELWIPEKTGHNVHFERPGEWIARVLDFLERRGSGL
jgi:pimeloyl-ACP methyl ester carboxylesterase